MIILLLVSVAYSRSLQHILSGDRLFVCMRASILLCSVKIGSFLKVLRWEVEKRKNMCLSASTQSHEMCVCDALHAHTSTHASAHTCKLTHVQESMAKKAYKHSIHLSLDLCKCTSIVYTNTFHIGSCTRAYLLTECRIDVVEYFVCIETASHSSHSFLNAPLQLSLLWLYVCGSVYHCVLCQCTVYVCI